MTETINNQVWYCRRDNSKKGPFTEEELVKLIQKGILEKTDEIWMMDMNDWMMIKDTIYAFYMPITEEF